MIFIYNNNESKIMIFVYNNNGMIYVLIFLIVALSLKKINNLG